ncbi:MAG: FtsX-like permease family protein [Desulfobacteraceae bacterium]|nr:FtsX-like permease family protein [Desulfobacteraceae bacterium]
MKRRWPPDLALWAARDLLRHPAEAMFTGLCLAALTAVLAIALLLQQGLTATARRWLAQSPALVVRRLDAFGWKPMPAAALAAARQVPGIIDGRARIWGTAAAGKGPLMVVALDPAVSGASADCSPPGPGVARVGSGLAQMIEEGRLTLQAAQTVSLQVGAPLDADASIVAHDLVWLNAGDARRLLGLKTDEVSDLALEVFHGEEAEAMRADLAAAFPWPVHITTRAEAMGGYGRAAARGSGLLVIVLLPAALAMGLLVAYQVREGMGRRREIALLKALGWSGSDVVRWRLYRALAVALPAVAVGALAAWMAIFWPGGAWVGPWLLGWDNWPPTLRLVSTGSLMQLVHVAILVLAPFLAAVVLPAASISVRAPLELLVGGSRR